MLGVLAVLEIAVHPEFHQLVANTPKQELEHPKENNNQNNIILKKGKPLNHPHDAEGDEDGIPGPEDEIDLVYDDIEGKDAEGIQLALPPRRPVLIVVAAGHLGGGSQKELYPLPFCSQNDREHV